MSISKKKGLGRGLSALFGDQNFETKESINNTNNINKISISNLSRNPYQPRLNFNKTKLEELAQSIKKNGIIQPIAVRPGKDKKGTY